MTVTVINKKREYIDIEVDRITLNIPTKGIMKLTCADGEEIVLGIHDFVEIDV